MSIGSPITPSPVPPLAVDHGVQFYQDDAFLIEVLADFADGGLASGAGVILITTEAHREQVRRHARDRGQNLERALMRGQLVLLDAASTLAHFLSEGDIDRLRFEQVMRPLVERLLARHGSIRAFGEMVDLLWRDGQRAATIALERCWNQLLQGLPVALLCSYHLDGFTDHADYEHFRGICQVHDRVRPDTGHGIRLAGFQRQAETLSGEIAHRRQAQQALERTSLELARANADLKRLLHVASHDLQEPLRRAGLHLDLVLDEDIPLGESQRRHLSEAIDCLTVMRQRVAAMRSLAEVVDGPTHQDQFPAELALRAAENRLAETIAASKATIRSAPLPQVVGDLEQMAEVFTQLIDNALVHRGDEPPLVWIAVHGHDDGVAFSIGDNGIGIPVDQREEVFRLFARLGDGSGLPHAGAGLTLVQKIVEGHGGRVWIEDGATGGAVLRFSWPSGERRAG